ncbi:hypothetical protein EVAR_76883_1 [Eumeta japonica]|uniref:Uncharacterized protein n=1 Tax=Eumeta variegata TaxID=151549 RepID=A0A4C1SEQ8_EUMVA|nr:hypothetical protein EVAR_76883_1 [Eumeta japonica]
MVTKTNDSAKKRGDVTDSRALTVELNNVCTPTATCEARAAISKSEHRNAVHHFVHTPQEFVVRGDCEEI